MKRRLFLFVFLGLVVFKQPVFTMEAYGAVQETSANGFADLPNEIFVVSFCFLDLKSLVSCLRVNQKFNEAVDFYKRIEKVEDAPRLIITDAMVCKLLLNDEIHEKFEGSVFLSSNKRDFGIVAHAYLVSTVLKYLEAIGRPARDSLVYWISWLAQNLNVTLLEFSPEIFRSVEPGTWNPCDDQTVLDRLAMVFKVQKNLKSIKIIADRVNISCRDQQRPEVAPTIVEKSSLPIEQFHMLAFQVLPEECPLEQVLIGSEPIKTCGYLQDLNFLPNNIKYLQLYGVLFIPKNIVNMTSNILRLKNLTEFHFLRGSTLAASNDFPGSVHEQGWKDLLLALGKLPLVEKIFLSHNDSRQATAMYNQSDAVPIDSDLFPKLNCFFIEVLPNPYENHELRGRLYTAESLSSLSRAYPQRVSFEVARAAEAYVAFLRNHPHVRFTFRHFEY